MSRPLTLALLLAIAAGSGGCEERQVAGPLATAEPRSESPPKAAKRGCPVDGAEPARGSVCIARRAPNWTYAFVYPPEAARIPALDSWLRSQSEEDLRTERDENDADGLGSLARYASEHPEGRFFRETVYTLDADLPELLALSEATAEYSGGAHGWFTFDTLLWDKARSRKLEPKELFSDPAAAEAEIQVQLCPILAESRRREAARGDGDGAFNGPCAKPPYNMTLLTTGGHVTTLKVTFTELEGYAGGTYEVYVPVTARLRSLVAERFRPSFALSASPARACNSNVGCVEGRPQRPRRNSDDAALSGRTGSIRFAQSSRLCVPASKMSSHRGREGARQAAVIRHPGERRVSGRSARRVSARSRLSPE